MATKPKKNVRWFQNRLLIWGKHNLRDYPWRKTNDPYSIMVAEILLQRSDADTVAPIYQTFLSRYPTLCALANAKLEDIRTLLQPLGLFFRADRLSQTAKILAENQREIPEEEQELLKLPGVGKYTARAICSQAFGQPAAVLDTNVVRILERFFGIKGTRVKSRCKILWSAAETVAPDTEVGYWNLTLLDFGAKVCTARNPKCSECPLALKCHWYKYHGEKLQVERSQVFKNNSVTLT